LAGLASPPARAAHTHASLLLGAESARPGETVLVGVQLRMDPRWHTYWKNPGLGVATKVEWKVPAGISAGEVEWPLPEKLPDKDLTTYIYKDLVILLVPLKLAPDLQPGPVQLQADISWLECDVQCVPGSETVKASLTVGSETKVSGASTLLDTWRQKVPRPGGSISAQASWSATASTNDMRPVIIEWHSPAAVSQADFFPDSSEDFEVQGETQRLPADAGIVRIQKQVKKLSAKWPGSISGVLVQQSGAERAGYQVKLELNGKSGDLAKSGSAASAQADGVAPAGLWQMLLYAFLGGLILNVMPCVLPVIALKILGFVSQARDDPARARKLGLIYALGVLLSFLALAALVIGVKAAGHKAGWGLQFGNPYFLVLMTTLVTLIALNLFGIFEVHLGGRTMDAASKLTAKHGAAGAFFNGLLATLLATSCTAPFLGAAIGFAFSQPPLIVLLILGTVGIGLAAPYVVLTWQPGWLKFLPKPGLWMERFKVAMGFPMLAAAVWLFSLAALHYGERSWWLAVFLVFVALAAWVFGEFVQRHRTYPGLAGAVSFSVLAAGYLLALESHLEWRQPLKQNTQLAVQSDAHGIQWQRWSPAAVTEARAAGRPVLVDFTAKWCLTCNTIVKPALESASVRNKVKALNAAAFLGDYTAFPDDITEELNRYGRAGVPLVLVFPRNPQTPAIVLPEALTPGMVVSALERAAL
jgi:thiol:disulfide interchange protein